jgi:ATPase family associated with various cellular activities (AAA)
MTSPAAERPLPRFAEVERRVLDAVRAVAATEPTAQDPFRGLYISDDVALQLADGATDAAGDVDGRLADVAALLGLPRLDVAVLALCAAPELDVRHGRLVGYLHDDVTRRLVSPRLAARLLGGGDAAAEAAVLSRFADRAPLRRTAAIRLLEADPPVPLADRLVKVDDRVAARLLGAELADGEGDGLLVAPPAHDPGRTEAVEQLRALLSGPAGETAILVCGPDAEELLATALRAPVLVVPLADAAPGRVAGVRLHAALAGAALCFRADGAAPEPRPPVPPPDERLLACARSREAAAAFGDVPLLVVEVPPPSYAERRELWRARLAGAEDAVDGVPARFRLSMRQIEHAARLAGASARARGAERPSASDVERGAREASRTRLGELAARVDARATWEELVLPGPQIALLRSISSYLRHRDLVLSEWGYERAAGGGQGIKALFAGESGTGKTMAAGVIAGDLGLDLFRVDLATVISKYIGETEQNLDRIFSAAEGSNALLFFDEADALFGKRSAVKDAHDRYANIEVAYLLQRMEGYPGGVVLATNLRRNMDDAFLRRLDVVVEFPFPDEADRRRIWHGVMPAQAPVAPDVDLDFLADRFKLSGGGIRNCALAAAFLAADDGGRVEMRHLVRAVALEYRKLGRLTLEADFAGFHEHARP